MTSGIAVFELPEPLLERVRRADTLRPRPTVSVCIPCRNEAATIATIVSQIRSRLVDVERPLVDELLVMDDGSVDKTASVAADAGATVVRVSDVLPATGPAKGKGNAMWASVAASTGDVVVWCDGDLTSFTPAYVERLVAPFVLDDNVAFVKGFYERPVDAAGEGGGRNTELVARPLLSLFFAELASVRQPLGGEYAATRTVLEELSFPTGYGVEIGLLIDAWRSVGAQRMMQVDLGVRRHRHQPLHELAAQALEIQHAVLSRAGLDASVLATDPVLRQPGRSPRSVNCGERPPLRSVEEYRGRSS